MTVVITILFLGVLLLSIIAFTVAIGESRYSLSLDRETQMLREELQRRSQEEQRLMELLEKERPHSREDQEPDRQLHLVTAKRLEQQEEEPASAAHESRRLTEELERERQGHLAAQQRIGQLEEENRKLFNAQQGLQRISQELRQSIRILENERAEHQPKIQHQAKRLEQERARMRQEHERLEAELEGLKQLPANEHVGLPAASNPWRRRLIPAVVLFVTMLAMWLTSLMVALYLLYP